MVKRIAMVGAAVLVLGGAAGAATSEDDALAKGRQAANVLTDTLRDQQIANVREKGAGASLPQCYYQALTVSKEVETTTGVRIKRTSSKLRNPGNAPDSFEQEALARFERFARDGMMPSDEIRKEKLDGKPVFRYVKPITMGASCVPCHAEKSALSEDVLRALDEKYPEDKAVGYKVGDLRGILSAVIPVE